VALTGSLVPFGSALLINDGANEVFYNPGNSSVTATTSSYPLPAGYCIGVWLNGATNVAAITASSTSTLRVIQYNGAAPISCGSSGSGGGGGGVVTQPTASLLNVTEASAAAILAGVQAPIPPYPVPHASTSALGTSLVVKASPGNLFAYNCTAITGGAAGYCIAYNATTAPSTGALTGTLVLDFCYFDTTARGCSLSRIPLAANYSAGITILLTSAVTPYTYTTGTDTGAISADYQ
jgi:hypothetical protein